MTKWETFGELRRAMKDPDRIGDVAVLKSELAGTRARAAIEAELQTLAEPLPHVDVAALRELPPGTLGRAYVEFLAEHGLHPFVLSGTLSDELVRRNLFMARYGLVHDVYHVLTGFDARWAGELGVWAFVAAQGYAFGHWLAALVGLVVYPIFAPWQVLRIWGNFARGVRMGRRARSLIALPFQTMWERPVTALRRELGIDPADELDALVPRPAI